MLLSPLSLFATAEEGTQGGEGDVPEAIPYEEYAERFDGKTLADIAVVNGNTPSTAQITAVKPITHALRHNSENSRRKSNSLVVSCFLCFSLMYHSLRVAASRFSAHKAANGHNIPFAGFLCSCIIPPILELVN